MKRILFLLAFFAMLFNLSSCRMRNVKGTPYKIYNKPKSTKRHYGARKNYHQRKQIWGKKHYGHRPYGHRGRYH